MTTRRSSSRRESPKRPAILIDSRGQSIRLGNEIGKGGEGSVFEVDGQPSLVAKVYNRIPLSGENVAKLDAMVSCRSPGLETISAWPRSVLFDARRKQPCGLLMPKVAKSRHLHELYGTYNRRRHFPEVRWHHLLLAARNVAAAFDLLHAAGIVVGDVNQGNLMVDDEMCIRFIDCDSFQISSNGTVFHCPVGSPHFTPPELQSKRLREVVRTPDHDCFGMAILIFHLLFVGRHPFAGRYRGGEELSIEKAITERRFAFSANKEATLVDPPPASLLLDDLPESLADLFESAFRGPGGDDGRPSAQQWVECLEALIRRRKACSFDESHVFYDQLGQCPWCRIEDEGGPVFFVLGGSASTVPQDRLDVLNRRIRELTIPEFPELTPRRFVVPRVLRPKRLATVPKISSCDAAAALMVASAVLCLLGAVSGLSLVIGTAGSLLGGGFVLFGREAGSRRRQVLDFTQQLAQIQRKLLKWSQAIAARHRQHQSEFESAVAELSVERNHYQAEGTQLQDVLVLQRTAQKDRFLAKHLIQDNVAEIPGLTLSMVSMLESFGVESALDADRLKLFGIPGLTPGLAMELMNWREQIEAKYVFKPVHGVTLNELEAPGEAAVRRFRVSQARRVLMAARQLDALADVGCYELGQALDRYDELAAQGHDVAAHLRDFQTSRRPLERLLNRSAKTTLAIAIGVPLLGMLLRLIFG